MVSSEHLIAAIAGLLAHEVKAQDLPRVASSLGLSSGEENEAFASKRRYLIKRLAERSQSELVEIGKKVHAIYLNDSLQQAIEELDGGQPGRISSITRQHLFSCFESLGPIQGKIDITDFMAKLGPLHRMPAGGSDYRCTTAYDEVRQHMALNEDYTFPQMLSQLGLAEMSNQKLVALLEQAVHPLIRTDADQSAYVESLNEHLKRDGLALVACDQISGYPVFQVVNATSGVQGSAKNLIFASTGPKPEIVFPDAINNDILLVKNDEHCLIYDRPFTKNGLTWPQLVDWWADRNSSAVTIELRRDLYRRLFKSLASAPERLLFRTYFETFEANFGDHWPALIPQVYLHYDPYTLLQRGYQRRLPRERMDFLLLLSSFERIVIEVDGQQHYSEDGKPSPSKYGEMVSADRDLRLRGYEVYRFGGAELQGETGKSLVANFFKALFRKHGVKSSGAMSTVTNA